jgi:hypothetical protein
MIFGGNGLLDSDVVLYDLLALRIIYPCDYFHEFRQFFQNYISVFLKVTNYTHCLFQDWIKWYIGLRCEVRACLRAPSREATLIKYHIL